MSANGLSSRCLRAQPRHRPLVGGEAGQVEAAEPLDGDDRAGEQRPDDAGERIGGRRQQPQ